MAMILDAFAGAFIEKLTSMANEKVVMVLGVKDEFKRLQQRMARIHKFLEAAEKQQLEDPAIKHWVGELKDVAYDADDIIDRCIIEGAALLLADRPSSSKKLAVCFHFSLLSTCFTSIPHRYEIAESIKALNHKLEEIYNDRLQLKLEESREQSKLKTITTVNTSQTAPLVDVDVIGSEIEEAIEELVPSIVAVHEKKCDVIAITGMGGIGKTTLAQKIYNNKKLQADFQIQVWMSVSQNYDEIELLWHAIKIGTGGKHVDTRNKTEPLEHLSKNKTELLPLLQSTYLGKRLFIVFDDVWSSDIWTDLFRSPLQSSASFLRVLVTTRDERIAREMGATHIHRVKQLSDQIGWEMLCKKVLLDEEEIKLLEDLGLQIVKKCFGLPLAIKVIAGLLAANKNRSRRDWERVLNNDVWSISNLPEPLHRALYLSYDNLPSNLKQCFLYCSLLPDNVGINRDVLIPLWVAEGFISEPTVALAEDVAEGYYHELIGRNLLLPDRLNDEVFRMHDVLRFMALFLSQDEISYGNATAATAISSSKKLRRISIKAPEKFSDLKDLVVKQKCLRTLLIFNRINVLNDNHLEGLERLRVLKMDRVDIDNIPNSLGDLIHLRYLNLDSTKIRALPESIGSLVNLQFLFLRHCTFLTTLPKSITSLHNLRSLLLQNTPLIYIPKGIAKLEKINNLSGFVVADPREPEDSYSSLEELLNSCYQLRILSISRMERAQQGAVSLEKLTRLIDLKLFYTKPACEDLTTEENITHIENILEELCPPKCLERLHIRNFFGTHYPSWMKSPSFGDHFPCLTTLKLENSFSCQQLPPTGELSQLTYLHIQDANLVKSIGAEFLGGGTHTTTITAFPNLQKLEIDCMAKLKEWSFDIETEGFGSGAGKTHVFPHLKKLSIHCCPKLKALPKCLQQCKIKKLSIVGNDSLKEVENLHVEKMDVYLNRNLERVSNLPALQKLYVEACSSLNCVEKLDSLRLLDLTDENMKGIPKWLNRLVEERKPANVEDDFCLIINSNDTTISRFLQGGPDWPIIVQIPQFIAYDSWGICVLRYKRNPYAYEVLQNPYNL